MNKTNNLDAGGFVAIQLYIFNVFSPLSYLGTIYAGIMNATINMQNLSDLLGEEADVVDSRDAKDLVVESGKGCDIAFADVSFRYASQAEGQGLKNISFHVPAGTTTAIVGQTGSGKTTVSRLIFRFYDAQGGSVVVDGKDVRNLKQKSLRAAIGIVPQDTVMFNDTLRYNIAYGKADATQEEIEGAAERAQLTDFIRRLEKGWDTAVGERGLKLSGGEKQRVAIARCLLKNPPVVVLDEATSALDNKTEKEVQDALKSLAGRTTIVVAHRLTTVRHADQIIVMKQGVIVERGTHDELMAANGEYASMWNAQLQSTDTPEEKGIGTTTPVPQTKDDEDE